MKAIGLDIGTTSISAIVLHAESGEVLEAVTLENDAAILSRNHWESLQDADAIWERTIQLLNRLIAEHRPIGAIGLTGQMHGIVYANSNGQAVGPLCNWQDGRGDLPMTDGKTTYAAYLSSGQYNLSTGYGAVTHFYNTINNLIPAEAASLCTIHSYIGMRLTGAHKPLLHSSDAASIGFLQDCNFSSKNGNNFSCFDKSEIEKYTMNPEFFPEVTDSFTVLGETEQGIPVVVAIGDNQASFIGSIRDMADSIVLNIGTSGQLSVLAAQERSYPHMELRPLKDKQKIAVGAALCGGKSYALLENFFRSVLEMAEIPAEIISKKLYAKMNAYAQQALVGDKNTSDSDNDKIMFRTQFAGTRLNPKQRAVISGLGMHNFDASHLIVGVLEGMVEELYEYYQKFSEADESQAFARVIGSGNALRNNPVLQKIASRRFGLPLLIPMHHEEAAYGAALTALAGTGIFATIEEAQRLIRYESSSNTSL